MSRLESFATCSGGKWEEITECEHDTVLQSDAIVVLLMK
jgi:hypothetical protein